LIIAKMKAITCLDPIDQAHDTILAPVDPKPIVKQTSHSLGLSPDAEAFQHTYAAARKLVHDFGDCYLPQHLLINLLTLPGISLEDIATLSEKFWMFYLDGESTTARTHCAKAIV
jgi:hypothetical protein